MMQKNQETRTKTENLEETNSKLRKDNEALKKTMNVLENIISGNNEETYELQDKNKELSTALKDLSDFKKRVYDFTTKHVGINPYLIENKQELKKVRKSIHATKKYMNKLEKELEGEEVYKVQNTLDEKTIDYWNRVDPKKKGLYFKEQQIKDMNFLLKNTEEEYQASISATEKAIEEIDEKLKNADQERYTTETKNNMKRQRIFLRRNIDVREQKIKSLQSTMDKYILEHKEIENDIYDKQNLLNASRELCDTVEQALKITEDNYTPSKTNTNSRTKEQLEILKDMGERFKTIIEQHATTRMNEKDQLFRDIEKLTTNTDGENLMDIHREKNKAKYNESSANKKVRRDKYFSDLGY